jgi:hypothetical protein
MLSFFKKSVSEKVESPRAVRSDEVTTELKLPNKSGVGPEGSDEAVTVAHTRKTHGHGHDHHHHHHHSSKYRESAGSSRSRTRRADMRVSHLALVHDEAPNVDEPEEPEDGGEGSALPTTVLVTAVLHIVGCLEIIYIHTLLYSII